MAGRSHWQSRKFNLRTVRESAILRRVKFGSVLLTAIILAAAAAVADETNAVSSASSTNQNATKKIIRKRVQTEGTNAIGKGVGTNATFQLQATLGDEKGAFKVYDDAVIAAVQQRWYDLLDENGYDGYKPGKVRIDFKLHFDGKITDVRASEITASKDLSALCEKAVLDASPYDKWPRNMREKFGKDVREIVFTFYYN